MKWRSTTILCVSKNGKTVLAGDGQVSVGNTVFKSNTKKVRPLFKGKVVAGFAGSTADAFTLFERFEAKLEQYGGDLVRSAIELAKDWRTEKMLRRLEAMLIVANKEQSLVISGNGDVIEPEEGCSAIGSGGPYAKAAALALIRHTSLDAEVIALEAMKIAADICVFTNSNIVLLSP